MKLYRQEWKNKMSAKKQMKNNNKIKMKAFRVLLRKKQKNKIIASS